MNETPWKHIQNKLQNPDRPEDNELTNWLAASDENKTMMDELKVIYSITGKVSESFVPGKDQAWEKVISRIKIPKHRLGPIKIMLRIAASFLLIALGIGGGLFMQKKDIGNSYTEVYSPYGHKTMIILPDSSQVWLNGNTRLKYATDFAQERNVELSGEALFKVAKNPNKLFTVKSRQLNIKVYGTTFNVKSYKEDTNSEVALVEGSVGLFHNNKLMTRMTPGEVITYDTSKDKFSSNGGNIDQITSWKSDELVIENESFENMVKYLERWYGVEIKVDKSLNQNLRLSFKVKTESLTELLTIINHITPVSYQINGKQVRITRKL